MKRSSLVTTFALAATALGLLAWLLVQEAYSVMPQAKEEPRALQDLKQRIEFFVSVSPTTVKRGETAHVTVTGALNPGFYTYAMTTKTPDQTGVAVSTFKTQPIDGLQPL